MVPRWGPPSITAHGWFLASGPSYFESKHSLPDRMINCIQQNLSCVFCMYIIIAQFYCYFTSVHQYESIQILTLSRFFIVLIFISVIFLAFFLTTKDVKFNWHCIYTSCNGIFHGIEGSCQRTRSIIVRSRWEYTSLEIQAMNLRNVRRGISHIQGAS